ncbi:MAG TPA: L,D-transpeptidase [Acidimicrobiales bacterium]|nr:L,D-transpeptidase [Acidimicrobiales bacterium]
MHRLTRRALVALAVAALFALGAPHGASAQGLLSPLLPGVLTPPPPPPPPPAPAPLDTAAPAPPGTQGLPEGSGSGRRVVYSNSQQRVWLVEEDGRIDRSYLVSGKIGEPPPGTYEVFSRSRHARRDNVTMEYMVRFVDGPRYDTGFHAIPVRRNGTPIQSEADLGTARSHGCVRQSVPDAAYLWDWAPLGTKVVVTS